MTILKLYLHGLIHIAIDQSFLILLCVFWGLVNYVHGLLALTGHNTINNWIFFHWIWIGFETLSNGLVFGLIKIAMTHATLG